MSQQRMSQIPCIDVKLAQRFVCPLARKRDNQRLGCGLWQLSRMASCFIQRVGVITSHLVAAFWQPSGMASSTTREAVKESFIIKLRDSL